MKKAMYAISILSSLLILVMIILVMTKRRTIWNASND